MNYQKIYDQLIANKQQNPISKKDGYCEQHHIIPKSLGGTNNKDNLVNLTAKEHYIAHLLLRKIMFLQFGKNSDQYKAMTYALWQMSNRDNLKQHITSKQYELLREDFSKIQSLKFSGENNPRYNKEVTQHTRALISKANKGKIPWIKGKKHTNKSKALMKKNHADISGNKNPMFGKKHTQQSCELMKEHAYDRSGNKNPMFGTSPLNFMSVDEIKKWRNNIRESQLGRVWVHKYENNKLITTRIKKEQLEEYLKNGYIKGRH